MDKWSMKLNEVGLDFVTILGGGWQSRIESLQVLWNWNWIVTFTDNVTHSF